MEITVKSSGSGEPALDFVAAAFHQATGHVVKVTYDDKAIENEIFDVIVASSDALERKFRPAGLVEAGGTSIGRMSMGVAIRPGAPAPDISSFEAFKRSVGEADALLLTTHTTGLYIETVLDKIGLLEQVKVRVERFPNAPLMMDRLLSGTGREFAILSINQVRRYEDKGLKLVGALPDEVQNSREFIAVPMSGGHHKDVAWDFVRFCGGPGKALLVANGFN